MNKTIMITGSTDGIGKLAAAKLAQSGHQLILHGRNPEKLSKVLGELKSATNNQKIAGYVADFSKLEDVKSMAAKIKEEQSSIDVLVNNAGIFKTAHTIAPNGIDSRIVVNYLAPFELTNALLPLLKKGDSPRIINLSSAAQASVSTSSFEKNSNLSHNEAYAQSKLAILLWSFYLAEHNPEVVTIALNPGSLLNTKMVKEAYGRFWSPADKGADIIIDLATNVSYNNNSGQYFDNDNGGFGKAHLDAYDNQIIENLISLTTKILS